MSSDWPFDDPEETEVVTLERILRGESPLLLVTHDHEDGGWQFLDGEHVSEDDGVTVLLGEMIQFDPSLEPLADLPPGWYAWRTDPDEPWQRIEGEPRSDDGSRRTEPEPAMSTPTNIEIKARVSDLAGLRAVVEVMADTEVEVLDQEDIFFGVAAGRLKLRILDEQAGELIHYHRADSAEPRASRYHIAPTSDPLAMGMILGQVLPVAGTVRKRRLVYYVGQTRVHLDQVESLGDFLELEVVLHPDQPEEEGVAIAENLLHRLGIDPDQLVQSAYIDLLSDRP
jgi:predicted adenylyl cyclase CyaB